MLSRNSGAGPQEGDINPQPWPWNHPRVLVEHPDEEAGLAIASGLRFAGYSVAVCPGPRGHARCPLTGPGGCAAAHAADLVVGSLGYERDTAQEVLHELRAQYPDTPLVVAVPSEVDIDLRDLLDGCHQIPATATPEQIVAAVQEVSGRLAAEEPSGA
jgi:CheY-like chemotaxis protein